MRRTGEPLREEGLAISPRRHAELPAQREAARRRAHDLGAVVVDEYVDRGESARSADRPALQAMLQRLRLARDIDYVIVHKLDRLARSREDDVSIVVDIRAAGAQLVSVSENIDEAPSGMLVHGIMATIAEFYSRNLSVEASKGLAQKAKMGGTIGLAPIGYLNSRSTVEGRNIGTVVIDEERAPLVRWAFEAFASGEWTISTLTDELADRGLLLRPTKRCPAKPLAWSRVALRIWAGCVGVRARCRGSAILAVLYASRTESPCGTGPYAHVRAADRLA